MAEAATGVWCSTTVLANRIAVLVLPLCCAAQAAVRNSATANLFLRELLKLFA